MRLMRVGLPGRERPVAQLDGRLLDLRPLTADIDGTFLNQLSESEPDRNGLPETTAASRTCALATRPGCPLGASGPSGQRYGRHDDD